MEVKLENVGRIFTWDWAIRAVNATIGPREIICILGANGSGKSTLLRLIGGVLEPTEGRVVIDERRVRRGAFGPRRKLLFLHPDQPIVGKSVIEHISTSISLFDADAEGIENVAADWLERLKVPVRSVSDQQKMSRGQRTKLWLATLFTLRPPLWLLDEPHQMGLDAHGIEMLESEILKHKSKGGSVVFTSQWPPHAKRIADRMLLLHENKPVFDGPMDAFSEDLDTGIPQLNSILRQLKTSTDGLAI